MTKKKQLFIFVSFVCAFKCSFKLSQFVGIWKDDASLSKR